MGELVLADNPQVEVATLVDVDELRALPICAAGPARLRILSDFLDATPFDPSIMDEVTLRTAFGQFLDRTGVLGPEADTATEPTMEPGGSTPDDGGAALAEAESANASETPAPAPADTDQPQSSPMAVVTVRCWNCNGTGLVEFGDDQPPAPCNMCKGTGKVEQAAA